MLSINVSISSANHHFDLNFPLIFTLCLEMVNNAMHVLAKVPHKGWFYLFRLTYSVTSDQYSLSLSHRGQLDSFCKERCHHAN